MEKSEKNVYNVRSDFNAEVALAQDVLLPLVLYPAEKGMVSVSSFPRHIQRCICHCVRTGSG